MSLTRSSDPSMRNTFAGLMSRCTMPKRCAEASASAMRMASSTAASTGMGEPMRSARLCPNKSSIAM